MPSVRPRQLILPGVTFLAFWAVAILGWRVSGYLQPLLLFGYIGTSLGIGLGLYATLPKKNKQRGRKLGGAALMHYLIAKIIGPMLFGRLWCGWACWTLMVLDLLPFQRSPGRVPGRWDWLRYGHFAASLGLVLLVWYGVGYRDQIHFGSAAGLKWMLAGNGLYYVAAIGLAYALRDNRAFCKYLCPVPVVLKTTSRFSLLKIQAERDQCSECEACVKMCPMDIQILDYIRQGQRVLSTECTLCQTCITVCAEGALKVSFGFDLGGKERLRVRPPSQQAA